MSELSYPEFLWDTFQRGHRWTLMADQKTLEDLGRRWQKALEIPVSAVTPSGERAHLVNSDSDPEKTYLVVESGCACPDNHRAPFGWCKHRLAAWMATQSSLVSTKTDEQIRRELEELYLSDEELEERYNAEKGHAA